MTGDNVTPAWQTCPTHGQTPNAWGCPECVRELRLRLHKLQAFAYQIKATPPAILAIMRENGIVLDNLKDPMQKLVFTMYNGAVRDAEQAEQLLEEIPGALS